MVFYGKKNCSSFQVSDLKKIIWDNKFYIKSVGETTLRLKHTIVSSKPPEITLKSVLILKSQKVVIVVMHNPVLIVKHFNHIKTYKVIAKSISNH